MDAAQQTVRLEGEQVFADGLVGDAELVGQVDRLDLPPGSQGAEDGGVPARKRLQLAFTCGGSAGVTGGSVP
ncbi:MAG: hypothetical protein ABIQ53_09870 [Terracoccus sp.]